jgi:exonuclease III
MVFSREAGPLKIATFNINNINKRLHNLTSWLARGQPDIVCLQELKVEQRAFPASALRDLGYHGVWLSASNRVAQWTYGQTAAAQGLTWLRADEMVPLGPAWRHVLSV